MRSIGLCQRQIKHWCGCAASLNYRDLMMVEGSYNPKLRLPLVPFSDGAGEIVEIGSDVTRWKVGDRVCPIFMQGWIDGELDYRKSKTTLGGDLDGCLREYGGFHEDGLVRYRNIFLLKKRHVFHVLAVTAWNALMYSGGLEKGETVLCQGDGRRVCVCASVRKSCRCGEF